MNEALNGSEIGRPTVDRLKTSREKAFDAKDVANE